MMPVGSLGKSRSLGTQLGGILSASVCSSLVTLNEEGTKALRDLVFHLEDGNNHDAYTLPRGLSEIPEWEHGPGSLSIEIK